MTMRATVLPAALAMCVSLCACGDAGSSTRGVGAHRAKSRTR